MATDSEESTKRSAHDNIDALNANQRIEPFLHADGIFVDNRSGYDSDRDRKEKRRIKICEDNWDEF
jgi:hypothetical protein